MVVAVYDRRKYLSFPASAVPRLFRVQMMTKLRIRASIFMVDGNTEYL